jgi:hypothetical protein
VLDAEPIDARRHPIGTRKHACRAGQLQAPRAAHVSRKQLALGGRVTACMADSLSEAKCGGHACRQDPPSRERR